MKNRTDNRAGSALIELALLAPALILLLLGLVYTGANADRYLALEQLARAAAHMHSEGVDFSLPEKRALLALAAGSLDLTESGDTVVYLSTIVESPDGPLIIRRFVVGAGAVGESGSGPAEAQVDGLVDPPVPTQTTVAAPPGARVYLAEAVHAAPNLVPPYGPGRDFRLRARAVY